MTTSGDLARLIGVLGDWQALPGPLYRRLGEALTAAAYRGHLDGMRLPAERRLAEHLDVSRSTIVRAYSILRERGVASSRQRSGTLVRRRGRSAGALTPILDRLTAEPAGIIDMGFGAFSLDELMADHVVSLAEASVLAPAHGFVPQGLAALREAIAEQYCRRGLPTRAQEILVTSGAQEAISLLATVLAGPNRTVLVEQSTFSGALEAFVRTGASVRAVAGDVAGIRPDHLAGELSSSPVALIYLVANCHNPTGNHIAIGRRGQIVELANAAGAPIVEDCTLDELRHDGPIDPMLQALDPVNVFGIGGVSKIAWGGLRVGWIRGPRPEILRLTQAKGCWNLSTSVLDQLMALRVFDDYERLVSARRGQARQRLDVLAGALGERLPDWRFDLPQGGASIWVQIPTGDSRRFAAAALSYGVAVGAGKANVAGDGGLDHLRLCFVLDEARLRDAVDRLARCWERYSSEQAEASGLPVAV